MIRYSTNWGLQIGKSRTCDSFHCYAFQLKLIDNKNVLSELINYFVSSH